jgi:hypothetical protein
VKKLQGEFHKISQKTSKTSDLGITGFSFFSLVFGLSNSHILLGGMRNT